MGWLKKKLKQVRKVASKADLGHLILKSMGLPDPVGDVLYGDYRTRSPAEAAAEANAAQVKLQQEAAAQALRQQELSNLHSQNLQTLANQPSNATTKFEFAGESDFEDGFSIGRKKKRASGNSNLSSQLGVV